MTIATYIFWICLFLLVYPYLIYPLILKLLARFFSANGKLAESREDWPAVSFIISAFNEEQVIGEKLENTLALDYPADKLEIIVISDASDDRTDEIVRAWSEKDSRIRLVRQEERRGKSAGLNHGVQAARGEAIVFSDANAMYKRDAIYELVKYFVNPEIGYVMGAALYNDGGDNEATESEGLYWRFELFLKEMESKFYSVVGGDGAIYAIRRNLFWTLKDDDINDFVNPLQIVAKGYRGIFNPRAICYEDAAEAFGKEFRRKRRIVNRSWRAVKRYLGWFNPIRQFRFLFELFSHKVLRWFSMVILIAMFVANILVVALSGHPFYAVTLAGMLLTVGLALYGASLDGKNRPIPKLVYLPYYFFLVNYAALLGIWDETRGVRHAVWNHVRDS